MKAISLLILLSVCGLASSSHAATIYVHAGGDLQQALNDAQRGDTLILDAGATFIGPFVLRNKAGTSYITIQSSELSSLPAEGQRVSPIHAVSMPRIVAQSNNKALYTEPSASYYKIIGIEFSPENISASIDTLILLGDGSLAQNSYPQVPHHLEIDRCYIHGYTTTAIKRGIGLNSSETSIINSYISDIHLVGQDSQGIGGWNGPGPFHIVNNFVAAAGENIMFGGALPGISELVPSDIDIIGNHLFKPLSWKQDEANYAGTPWKVKNLLEFKSGQHVMIEGNLLENCWGDTGYGALNLTVKNDSGSRATIQDLDFRNNVVRHVSLGVNILGLDYEGPTVQGHDVRLYNNLFYDMNTARWTDSGYWLKLSKMNNLTLDHNLILNAGISASGILSVAGDPCTGFVMTNNIATHNSYGIKGNGPPLESGRDTINHFFPGSIFHRNVIAGLTSDGTSLAGYPYYYPTDNFYPATLEEVGFINMMAGDYRLATGTPYKGQGTDGLDIGIDQNTIGALLTQPFYFSAANYTGSEGAGSVTITVNRPPGLPSASVNYATGDGTAHQSGDYNITLGTLSFGAGETSKTFNIFITDDGYEEGDETAYLYLSNPNGINAFEVPTATGVPTLTGVPTATLTIVSNDSGNSQPLDDGNAFFVRQHYLDFLGREPDQGGFQAWQDILNNCGITVPQPCDRIEVSSAFFRSPEFQARGYFIYRFYSAIGRIPIYSDFMPDFAKVSGFLSAEQLEANKVAFVNEFMTRQEFRNKYEPRTLPADYVNGLLQTVDLPNHPTKQFWIDGLTNGSLTRAQVLRGLVESEQVYNKYYNEAFVIMQYFGYLRRTADISYQSWIQTMNGNGGDYRVMINGFMNSAEYRQRFGP